MSPEPATAVGELERDRVTRDVSLGTPSGNFSPPGAGHMLEDQGAADIGTETELRLPQAGKVRGAALLRWCRQWGGKHD